MRRDVAPAEAEVILEHICRDVRPDDMEAYRLLGEGQTYIDLPKRLQRYRSDVSPTSTSVWRGTSSVARSRRTSRRMVGEHHRQVAHHPARIVTTAPLTHRRQPLRERPRQPQPVGHLSQQRSARVTDQTVCVRPDIYGETAPIALHLQGDPLEPELRPSTSRRIPSQADSSAAPTTGAAAA